MADSESPASNVLVGQTGRLVMSLVANYDMNCVLNTDSVQWKQLGEETKRKLWSNNEITVLRSSPALDLSSSHITLLSMLIGNQQSYQLSVLKSL